MSKQYNLEIHFLSPKTVDDQIRILVANNRIRAKLYKIFKKIEKELKLKIEFAEVSVKFND